MMHAQSRGAACNDAECGHPDCATCLADRALTRADWMALHFYNRAADQWDNQAPMGTTEGKPIVSLRFESMHAALVLYRYDPDLWPWLVDTARLMFRLMSRTEKVAPAEYVAVYGKARAALIPEEC